MGRIHIQVEIGVGVNIEVGVEIEVIAVLNGTWWGSCGWDHSDWVWKRQCFGNVFDDFSESFDMSKGTMVWF